MATNGITPDQVGRIKEDLGKDTRDIADLWNDALKSYKGIVGVDLQPRFQSVDAMIEFGSNQMNNFHSFRHNQKKADKLRSLFIANLSYIEQGAQQLIAAATPAFPPAAAIGTAFTYMLSACQQVSADYDVVAAFFEDLNAFLHRITILESRLPSYAAYRNCLMDVFTSLLEMCGFATKYIELGRFKKWVINMVGGADGELAGARTKMGTSMSRLQAATEYAILGNTEELQRMNADLQKNQDLQISMAESQTRMLESVLESQDSVRSDLVNIQKLLAVFDARRSEDSAKQGPAKAGGMNKPPTSNRVRSFFEDSISPETEYRNIKDNFIPDTCTWLFSEPLWEQWAAQEEGKNTPKILALSGLPGAGKSHLAAAVYDQLVAASSARSGDTAVVHFFFRETTKDLHYFIFALNWITIQLAEASTDLCEMINAEISREDTEWDSWAWEDIWQHLLKPLFSKSGKYRLQIVLDGLDELQWTQKENMLSFLKLVASCDSNISLVCTLRSDLLPEVEPLGASSIVVTKEKQLADLKALIWHHLNHDSGFRKFSRYMKQRIATALEEKADGMLYAEHMLRQFSAMGREPLIIKQLENAMPANMAEFHETILADLQHRIPSDQHQSLKVLLTWLSFSDRPLTLNECLAILKLVPGKALDLEDQLQGKLATILKIAGFEERDYDASKKPALDAQKQSDPDNEYDDGDLPVKFQERSIRGFFRSAKREDTGLRTFAEYAHREIFVTCSNIICGKVQDVHEGLQKYAASKWAFHQSWAGIGNNALAEDDRLVALEAMGAIMGDERNGASKHMESFGVDYKELGSIFKENWFIEGISFWAKQAHARSDKLSSSMAAWATKTAADQDTAFLPLAAAHVTNWFQAPDLTSALRSYRYARTALRLTTLDNLVDADEEDSDDEDEEAEAEDEQTGEYSKDEIAGIAMAFPDIPTDANAHWAVALLLEHSQHYTAALKEVRKALDKCDDPVDRFRVLSLTAHISLGKGEYQAAYDSIQSALSVADVPASLLRKAYVTRGKAERHLKKLDESIASYEAARHADPEEPLPGDILQQEFDVYEEQGVPAEAIGLVKKWKPLERLAWMAWKYDEDADQHEQFRRIAGMAGEKDFLVQAYEEVIDLLDRVDAAAPIRFQLALAYRDVHREAEPAKALLDEILDTTTTGENWAFTNEEPGYTLINAIVAMSDIIYEQFRSTGDRELKAKLFAEAKGLTQRKLAHSVTTLKSELTHHVVVLARMARKMGPRHEFQETLDRAFNICYDALVDNVDWNDSLNLNLLAEVLCSLDGLERESQILISAQFAELDHKPEEDVDDETANGEAEDGKKAEDGEDKKDKDDNDDDGDDDDDDDDDEDDADSLPDDEGDLGDITMTCDGECKPRVTWRAWKGRPMYQCLICSEAWFCEACHAKRLAYDAGDTTAMVSNFCGRNHRYVRGPVDGWKGIKDGIMTIEGDEPLQVPFKDWLAELKQTKWKAAWERFWLAEE